MLSRLAIAILMMTSSSLAALLNSHHEERALRLSKELGIDLEVTRAIVAETLEEFKEERVLAAASWSYSCATGPKNWGNLDDSYNACSGVKQSPINVPAIAAGRTNVTNTKNPVQTLITTKKASYAVSMDHGAPKWTCAVAGTCGSVVYNGQTYNHLQTHFHAPSEHMYNGIQFAMDAHMVHKNANGELLVFGVVFDGKAAANNTATPVMKKMLKQANPATTTATQSLDLGGFVTKTSGFYQYTGSLTTPPCTEGVTWILQAAPVALKQSQIDAFKATIAYPGSARPVQALNGRTIDYQVDYTPPPAYNWLFADPANVPLILLGVCLLISFIVAGACEYHYAGQRKAALLADDGARDVELAGTV